MERGPFITQVIITFVLHFLSFFFLLKTPCCIIVISYVMRMLTQIAENARFKSTPGARACARRSSARQAVLKRLVLGSSVALRRRWAAHR